MGKLETLLNTIRNNLKLLDKKLEEEAPKDLVSDPFSLNAVLHILQVSIQALIDLACHALAEAGVGVVDRYSALPDLLAGAGAVRREDAALLKKIIGFRNVVVHGYRRVSRDIVLLILLERRYRDILRLAIAVAEWAKSLGVDP